MLYGKDRKILKAINELCSKDRTESTTLDLLIYFHNRTTNWDLDGALLHLKSEGYIDIREYDPNLSYFSPTYEGRHYKAKEIELLKQFIFKSVLVPIAVAFITALLVSILLPR